MSDTQQKIASPAAIAAAEKAKPNWKVVPHAPAAAQAIKVDAHTPELPNLRKYFGGNAPHSAVPDAAASSELVTMEPVNEAATRVGRKVVVVQNGKIVGEQG